MPNTNNGTESLSTAIEKAKSHLESYGEFTLRINKILKDTASEEYVNLLNELLLERTHQIDSLTSIFSEITNLSQGISTQGLIDEFRGYQKNKLAELTKVEQENIKLIENKYTKLQEELKKVNVGRKVLNAYDHQPAQAYGVFVDKNK